MSYYDDSKMKLTNVGFNNLHIPYTQNEYYSNNKKFLNSLNKSMSLLGNGLDFYNTLYNYNTNKYNNKINYDLLNLQELRKLNQINNIETQIQKNINQERKELNKKIGDLIYSSTQKGVKSTSGTTQNNIEKLSKNLGEDEIKLMKEANRKMEQQGLNAYANYFKNTANYQLQKQMNKHQKDINLLKNTLNSTSLLSGLLL